MRILLVFLLLSGAVAVVNAQMNPVTWMYESKKISPNEYDLILTADVDDGWNIYSQYLESDEGPVATSINFTANPAYELVGETREEGHKKEGYDEIFGMNLIKYSGKVQFIQHVKLSGKVSAISGSLEFMTCDDEQCLPPRTVDFSIDLKN